MAGFAGDFDRDGVLGAILMLRLATVGTTTSGTRVKEGVRCGGASLIADLIALIGGPFFMGDNDGAVFDRFMGEVMVRSDSGAFKGF